MKYNGVDLLTIIDQKSHPSFYPQTGKPKPPVIEHSLLLDEMRTARAFGVNDYFNAPREMQALMVATLWVDATINAFRSYDMRPDNNK